MTKGQILARLRKAKKQLAKERDELREIQSDAETLLEPLDRGIEELEAAIDAISEHV